jgi:hypothetical protein
LKVQVIPLKKSQRNPITNDYPRVGGGAEDPIVNIPPLLQNYSSKPRNTFPFFKVSPDINIIREGNFKPFPPGKPPDGWAGEAKAR